MASNLYLGLVHHPIYDKRKNIVATAVTNLDIHDIEFVCFQEFIHDERFWQDRHFIFFDYACRTDSTDVVLNHEAQDYTWVDLDRTLELPVDPYTAVVIERYRQMKSK